MPSAVMASCPKPSGRDRRGGADCASCRIVAGNCLLSPLTYYCRVHPKGINDNDMTGVVREIDVRTTATDMQTTQPSARPSHPDSASSCLVCLRCARRRRRRHHPWLVPIPDSSGGVGWGRAVAVARHGPLVMTTMLWLAALALLMQTAAILVPNKEWSFASGSTPLFFFTIGASLWAGRVARIGWPANTRASSATADLAAALGSLGWALVFVRNLATADRTEAARFLVGSRGQCGLGEHCCDAEWTAWGDRQQLEVARHFRTCHHNLSGYRPAVDQSRVGRSLVSVVERSGGACRAGPTDLGRALWSPLSSLGKCCTDKGLASLF